MYWCLVWNTERRPKASQRRTSVARHQIGTQGAPMLMVGSGHRSFVCRHCLQGLSSIVFWLLQGPQNWQLISIDPSFHSLGRRFSMFCWLNLIECDTVSPRRQNLEKLVPGRQASGKLSLSRLWSLEVCRPIHGRKSVLLRSKLRAWSLCRVMAKWKWHTTGVTSDEWLIVDACSVRNSWQIGFGPADLLITDFRWKAWSRRWHNLAAGRIKCEDMRGLHPLNESKQACMGFKMF